MEEMNWPPDYSVEFSTRAARIKKMMENPELIAGAKEYYKTRPAEFIEDWCCTYDPRNSSKKLPTLMPFVLFPRQRELVQFLQGCLTNEENGLVEKARDMGATWLSCAFSVWVFIFHEGASVGWGSRKEMYVDRIDDPDSIFEKIRMTLDTLPPFLRPKGYDRKKHASYMKIINPENGASVTGEAGDNIGRGGRKLIYFKDEAQPMWAKVMTPRGPVNMGDIEVGQTILGPTGTRKVTQIKDFEQRDVYKITFGDGSSTHCSPNHLWAVEAVIGSRKRKTLSTLELLKNYIYKSPGGQVMFRYRVATCEPVQFAKLKAALPLDPYVVGALIGDGSTNKIESSTPTIISADKEILDHFESRLPENCGLRYDCRYSYRIIDTRGVRGRGKRSAAKEAIKAAGISNKRSWEKSIPSRYKFASVSERLELIRGLMDTDGSGSGGVASYHTASPQLAQDFMFVVQSLGGVSTYNVKPDARGYRDMYVMHIALPDGAMPFRLTRKIKSLRKRRHPVSRTIKSIEKVGRESVRCISVDAEDGLYLTDSFIITHNSAHYARPELVEAALGDNTNVQIDISSVNGTGNVFHRKREGGKVWSPGVEIADNETRVFIFDWRDHPNKTQEWYDKRRDRAEAEGLLHLFKQEVDRDYSGAIENVVIPSEWVQAAIDLHLRVPMVTSGQIFAGLDVADEGGDLNAFASRNGVKLNFVEKWGKGDTFQTAKKAIQYSKEQKVLHVSYDSIGVGAGVKAAFNQMDTGKIQAKAWNAAERAFFPERRVVAGDPDSPKNKDFYSNLKAQAWWELRKKFYVSYRALKTGKVNVEDVENLIVLSGDLEYLHEIVNELSRPVFEYDNKGRLKIDKKPNGAKSPNMADAIVMAFWPKTGGGFYA